MTNASGVTPRFWRNLDIEPGRQDEGAEWLKRQAKSGKTHLQVNPAAGQGLDGGIPEAAPHDGVAYLTENGYMKNQ